MKFFLTCLLFTLITVQKKPLLLEVIVKDQLTNSAIPDVRVKIRRPDGWTDEVRTNAEGVAKLNVETESRYTLTLTHPSYYVLHPPEIALAETAPTQLIFLQPIHKGTVIRWDGIRFGINQAELLESSAASVTKLKTFLEENSGLKVEIGCHTDARGKAEHLMELSRRRASALREELVARGIAPERLLTRGYGGRLILNQCTNIRCDMEEHARNRRIELIVLENKGE